MSEKTVLNSPKSKTLPTRKFVKITTPAELEIALGTCIFTAAPVSPHLLGLLTHLALQLLSLTLPRLYSTLALCFLSLLSPLQSCFWTMWRPIRKQARG